MESISVFGDHGVDDHGWGCVYRNIQTATNAYDLWYPEIQELLRFFQKETAVGTARWIEPVDACRFFRHVGIPAHHKVSLGTHGMRAFSHTHATHDTPRGEFVLSIVEHLSGTALLGPVRPHSVIIDNGTFSYILLGATAQGSVVFGDPHKPRSPDNPCLKNIEDVLGCSDTTWAACFVG